jgi:hypothetical protein
MDNILEARSWILCPYCGEKHELRQGMFTPIYFCGDVLCVLKEGDEIEYGKSEIQDIP